ncbi:MAG: transposase [Elusimicrobia bacterium]|nr:transposase [Elusimicrobiota bacterium]
MARPLRVEYPGAFYHVFTRGNDRRWIFRDNADRKRFFGLIAESAERWAVRVHAYALMDNHYHLLIEAKGGFLSAPIRQINGVYTQHYNRRYKTSGHLFHGRFKALIVDKDGYLLTLSRYIHQNPVRAKMVSAPEKYRWSSCRAFLGLEEPPQWLELGDTLGQFGESRQAQIDEYAKFLAAGSETEPMGRAVAQLALGSDAFVQDVKKKVAALKRRSREHSHREKWIERTPKEAVIKNACQLFGISQKELFGERWSHSLAKPVAMKYLRDSSRLTLEEIAKLFGIGYSGVSLRIKRLAEQARQSEDLRDKVAEMEDLLAEM